MKLFLIFLISSFLFLIGCVSAPKAPVKMVTPFIESDYACYLKPGTGSIYGEAFLKTVGGEPKYGVGAPVLLFPGTAYYAEYLRHLAEGRQVADLDPRCKKYVRRTTADAQGYFEFNNLPPGDYILLSEVKWGIPTRYGIRTTGGDVLKPVSLGKGEKLKVMLTY